MRRPRLVLPLLVARSVARLTPEVLAARPTWRARLGLGAGYAWRAMRSPLSPAHMARWVEAWMATDLVAECAAITAPTTVITGEWALDRVVPTDSTREILELVPHARHVEFSGTGHIGVVTKPQQFAELIQEAIGSARSTTPPRRRHAS
jgi:pimeloyl-ACP methyl ester carboxylesterase